MATGIYLHKPLWGKDRPHPLLGKHHSEETKKRISNSKKGCKVWNKGKEYLAIRGNNHWNWKSGRSIDRGYIEIYTPTIKYGRHGRRRKEHRIIMEKFLGRKLKRWQEIIHHINFNRADNRIENLQLMNRQDHLKLHKNLCQ